MYIVYVDELSERENTVIIVKFYMYPLYWIKFGEEGTYIFDLIIFYSLNYLGDSHLIFDGNF